MLAGFLGLYVDAPVCFCSVSRTVVCKGGGERAEIRGRGKGLTRGKKEERGR